METPGKETWALEGKGQREAGTEWIRLSKVFSVHSTSIVGPRSTENQKRKSPDGGRC